MKKNCIIIAGPTAVGKTSIAIAIAKHFSTEIISADSRQCFKELNIGVAKPSLAELEEVHHYFINSHSIHENVSAADFEKYALASIEKIFQQHDIAVMTGGTGLYIKAFCEGLDAIPATDPVLRNEITGSYKQHGINWLQEQLQQKDPLYYSSGEMQNPQRMMRALEVILSTGKSIISFQSKQKLVRDFNIIQVGLELPRPVLYEQINKRVEGMIEMGLVEEARELLPYRDLNALQTVGYKELFSYFDNEATRQGAIELIQQNTRHYAKRQMTWFKRDESVVWMEPGVEVVIKYIQSSLNRS